MVDFGRIFSHSFDNGNTSHDKRSFDKREIHSSYNVHHGMFYNTIHNIAMEMKIMAIALGKLFIPFILGIDLYIVIMGQLPYQLPEWAQLDPAYRHIFLVIGIIYLAIRVAVYAEKLWSIHMDNLKKNKELKDNDKK